MAFQELSPDQVGAWADSVRAAGQAPVVLDVRETFEFEAANVQAQAGQQDFTLLHIPMSQFTQRLEELPDEDTPLAILCHHGQRSVAVGQFLEQRGFSDLYNITGGIDYWSRFDQSIPRYLK